MIAAPWALPTSSPQPAAANDTLMMDIVEMQVPNTQAKDALVKHINFTKLNTDFTDFVEVNKDAL
eukprot:12504129-Heterocapsa_arctica.AAC.1